MKRVFVYSILALFLHIFFITTSYAGMGGTPQPLAVCEQGLDCYGNSIQGSFFCSNGTTGVYCCPPGMHASSDNKCLPLCPGGSTQCATGVSGGNECVQSSGGPSTSCCPAGQKVSGTSCVSFDDYCGTVNTASACIGSAVGTKTSAGCICNSHGISYGSDANLGRRYFICSCDGTETSPTNPVSAPQPGWTDICSCYGSGECVDKPNNGGSTHPASECSRAPDGACKWDPGYCGRANQGSAPATPDPRVCRNTDSSNGASPVCRGINYDVSKVTVKVGETKKITLGYFGQSGTVGMSAITWTVSDPKVALVGGKAAFTRNICCNTQYGGQSYPVLVTGVATGSAFLNTQISAQNSASCSQTGCLQITVVPGDDLPTPGPLVCDLPVLRVSPPATTRLKFGTTIRYGVTPVPSDRFVFGASVRYEGQITYLRDGEQVGAPISLTPVSARSPQFRPFTVSVGNATMRAQFRYCVKDVIRPEECSPWGM